MRVKGLVAWPLVGGVRAGAEKRVFAWERKRGGAWQGATVPWQDAEDYCMHRQ